MVRGWRDPVEGFFEIRPLAVAHPETVDAVFRKVLRQPGFTWAEHGEALLRRRKPWHYDVLGLDTEPSDDDPESNPHDQPGRLDRPTQARPEDMRRYKDPVARGRFHLQGWVANWVDG